MFTYRPKLSQKGAARVASLLSTKTLTHRSKFHGSDGILQGAIDLTRINHEEENGQLPSEPTKFKKFPDNISPMANSASPNNFKSCSIPSIKTLASVREKKHDSDSLHNSFIDLTKLAQNNIDCSEHCDKVECPLHQKLFFNANHLKMESANCEHCKNAMDKHEPINIEATQDFQEVDAEILPENISKYVDFALEEVNKQHPNGNLHRKGTTDKQNALQAKAERGLKGHDLSNRSVTSTKTLMLERKDELRNSTKGVMDLHKLGFNSDSETIEEKKMERNLGAIPRTTEAKPLAKVKELQHIDTVAKGLEHSKPSNTDRSIISSKGDCCSNKSTSRPPCVSLPGSKPVTHRKSANGNNLCFDYKCSDHILNKVNNLIHLEQTRQEDKTIITEGVDHQGIHGDIVGRPRIFQKEPFSPTNAAVTEEFRCTGKSHEDEKKSDRTGNHFHEMYLASNTQRSKIKSPNGTNNSKNHVNKHPDSKTPKSNEVYATFNKPEDSSAVFRKVFSVDGVGLECQCCISSFKLDYH